MMKPPRAVSGLSPYKGSRALLAVSCLLMGFALRGAAGVPAFEIKTASAAWEQTVPSCSFTVFMEREELSRLDRVSRMVFAAQGGKEGLNGLSVAWRVARDGRALAQNTASITGGLVDVSFSLAGLEPGRYDVHAELLRDGRAVATNATFFRMVPAPDPAARGRVAVNLPRGVPAGVGAWPVSFGIPFPKGALWNEHNVRMVKADGSPVPVQVAFRSRWGHKPETSIRWLGVDFQAESAPPWWPNRKDTRYFLEYGPEVKAAKAQAKVTVKETEEIIEVDTGAMKFSVSRKRFCLLDNVIIGGRSVMKAAPLSGLYLVDHEGNTYRAANDVASKLTVEEMGDQRVTLRAEGWYVKDGASGNKASYTLPTDKLCKFITRIEAYAGKSYVRVLSTWVLTFDSFTVRLKDVGFSLPLENAARAEFGVEGSDSIKMDVPQSGIYMLQHLPDAFSVEEGGDVSKVRTCGKHSAGWGMVYTSAGTIGVGHRDTWQRFPKELEVLPNELKFHVWPAHGREHPEIDEYDHRQINRLWFAHQGRELNLAQPWRYYFAVAKIADDPSAGIYKPAGMPMAGIHSSAMGVSVTSDLLLQFGESGREKEMRAEADCFQAAPHALADPAWVCGSLAAGYMHPYDPENMAAAEEAIAETMRAYWEIQDECGEYGMWLYRPWHHSQLRARGKLELYRLYNATHHYEAFMPWMLYARSGDPFYLTQGWANMRLLPEVQVIHYDDPAYPHREFHFGQGRLVGSTKHTNGFNTWGGDHAILAHLTCYNAMILAYYLTGDLRLREVVVDEWQNTLINARKNPEYAEADRTDSVGNGTMAIGKEGARDVTCALGELIDLYQLTYDPRLLALMAPMMDYFLNRFMRPWGMPLHNVLLFYGSQQARQQLLDGVAEYRRTAGRPADPKGLWYTHAPFDNFAMAAIVDSNINAHVDAWLSAEVPQRADRARKMRAQGSNSVSFCTVPDWVVYMPRVMEAVARSGGNVSLSRIACSQSMPAGDATCAGWMRCIVLNDRPEPFAITIFGKVGQGGVPVKVFGPDNKSVMEVTVPEGMHAPHEIKVADGRAGQYVIFVKARDGKDDLLVPLTALPEVYRVGYWQQHQATRFFIRSRSDAPETVEVQPHGSAGQIVSDAQELLADTENGGWLSAKTDPAGIWIVMKSRYVHCKSPVTLSVAPVKWFVPDEEKMSLKP